MKGLSNYPEYKQTITIDNVDVDLLKWQHRKLKDLLAKDNDTIKGTTWISLHGIDTMLDTRIEQEKATKKPPVKNKNELFIVGQEVTIPNGTGVVVQAFIANGFQRVTVSRKYRGEGNPNKQELIYYWASELQHIQE